MTWQANQVYARAFPQVIAAFRERPFLAEMLYHVKDWNGIREKTDPGAESEGPEVDAPHPLPEGGLLAVAPDFDRTYYDRKLRDDDPFVSQFRSNRPWKGKHVFPAKKWESVDSDEPVEVLFPRGFDRDYYPLGLFRFLKQTQSVTRLPLVYYDCFSWGGDVEAETAFVFDEEDRVYARKNDEETVEHTVGGERVVRDELLCLALSHIGLELPSPFFAPHERSFDWRRSWIGRPG